MDKINFIEQQLQGLESTARKLHISTLQRAGWLQAMQTYAIDFIDSIEERPVYIETISKGKELLDHPISEEPRSMEELLQMLRDNVDSTGLNPASGGHLGYIPGGGVMPTAMGDFLAAITNRYAGVFFANPGAVRMENMLIRWMCSLIGYPETSLGNLTSGGSIANLIAIVSARDDKKIKAAAIDRSVIYLTTQVHHSIQKAIRIAGLSEAVIREIEVDAYYRMNVGQLEKQIQLDRANGLRPFLLVSSAGTTDTGAIDPLDALADIAEQHVLWHHVDAAYGGFFILTEEVKARFKGIERSDSVTIDPHKGLFLAYGTGAVLIKNVAALKNTHYYLANYMQDTVNALEELSPADLSPELTKHFRGLRMWLPLQLYGLAPFRACLQEKLWLCRYFYERIGEMGFERGQEPELSVAIYRYIPNQGDANSFNAQLVEAVRLDGRVFLSSTTINGVFWLRLAVLSFRTHKHTIDLCLKVLEEKVQELV